MIWEYFGCICVRICLIAVDRTLLNRLSMEIERVKVVGGYTGHLPCNRRWVPGALEFGKRDVTLGVRDREVRGWFTLL